MPLVVIGGSAGALVPLTTIVRGLSAGLPAAVCVVIHMPDRSSSELAALLGRTGRLPARFADDGARLVPGTVTVAPPGTHLLVEDGRLRLSAGARENGTRPAIDVLFRTAARTLGPRVVSVVLSGTLDDGAAGTVAVRRSGGMTIAQEPAEAVFGDMPRNAIAAGGVVEVLPAGTIAERIEELAAWMAESADPAMNGDRHGNGAVARGGASGEAGGGESGRARDSGGTRGSGGPADLPGDHPHGDPGGDSVERGILGRAEDLEPPGSPYSCPACGGVLFERPADQYLCRLGHRYSPHTLSATQDEVVEDALWTALRSLEESASLSARVRDRATARGDDTMAERFDARRAGAEARATRIRNVLRGGIRPGPRIVADGESVEDRDAGTAESEADRAAKNSA